jgi:hypothetical protein
MAPLQFGDDDGMDCESSKRGHKRLREDDDGEPREEMPDDETEDEHNEEEEAMGTLVIKEEDDEEDDGEDLDIQSQPRKKARTERSMGDSLSAQRK